MRSRIGLFLAFSFCLLCLAEPGAPVVVRVATFNIEDVREDDVARPDNPRLKALAEIIQRIGPNIVFLNEIAYDMPGAPGFKEGSATTRPPRGTMPRRCRWPAGATAT